MKKIVVFGAGYVGLSLSLLLAQKNKVLTFDIDEKKVEKINNRESPIEDPFIKDFLRNIGINLHATSKREDAVKNADYFIIATPTDYDPENNFFDTSSVESSVRDITSINKDANIVIKSTVPVGFTSKLKDDLKAKNLFFSPEFLREGSSLQDNLEPSRIIIGCESKQAKEFATLLVEGVKDPKKKVPVLYTKPSEAEAIKLFSNTYLAMRVAFFNELDTYCEMHKLSTHQIITGVGLDKRIGDHYNNQALVTVDIVYQKILNNSLLIIIMFQTA